MILNMQLPAVPREADTQTIILKPLTGISKQRSEQMRRIRFTLFPFSYCLFYILVFN